jgi:hypothetical protein
VVRFNYKPDEKVALIEFIGMIKGLANAMIKEDGLLAPIIRNCIHDEVQEYVQIGLRDLVRVATKKKKKDIRGYRVPLTRFDCSQGFDSVALYWCGLVWWNRTSRSRFARQEELRKRRTDPDSVTICCPISNTGLE